MLFLIFEKGKSKTFAPEIFEIRKYAFFNI